ncbi:aspartoacylase-like [Clavelina lepadiformis]|uniref:aspartoacylase-like n=1 Tax=Clavelina lepadiformis TaxID=159417 RepID=UPI0040424C90
MRKFNEVVIFGGTHGNEMSGIHLVRNWLADPQPLKDICGCNVTPCIANPEAVQLCRRYKDCDLNRQFSVENYQDNHTASTPYEVKQAKHLNSLFSDLDESSNTSRKLLLDLHNTTANTKCCLILTQNDDVLPFHLAKYIQNKLPQGMCNILMLPNSMYSHSRTITKYGLGIEVGPQPQGVLRADICSLQKNAVFSALEFSKKFNDGDDFSGGEIFIYTVMKPVYFPVDSKGNHIGMVHPKLQDNDFKLLSVTDPVFLMTDGCVKTISDVSVVEDMDSSCLSTVFVNEAAYYEKNVAFFLTVKSTIDLASFLSPFPKTS